MKKVYFVGLLILNVSCATTGSYPPLRIIENASKMVSKSTFSVENLKLIEDTKSYAEKEDPLGIKVKAVPKHVEIPADLKEMGFSKVGIDICFPCQPLAKARDVAFNRAVNEIMKQFPSIIKAKTVTGIFEKNGSPRSVHRVMDIITLTGTQRLEFSLIDYGWIDEGSRGVGAWAGVAGRVVSKEYKGSRKNELDDSTFVEREIPVASTINGKDAEETDCLPEEEALDLVTNKYWPLNYKLPASYEGGKRLKAINGKYYLIQNQITAEDAISAAKALAKREMDYDLSLMTIERSEVIAVCGSNEYLVGGVFLGWIDLVNKKPNFNK